MDGYPSPVFTDVVTCPLKGQAFYLRTTKDARAYGRHGVLIVKSRYGGTGRHGELRPNVHMVVTDVGGFDLALDDILFHDPAVCAKGLAAAAVWRERMGARVR